MTELYDRSTADKDIDDSQLIVDLLHRFSDTFSKDDLDLGLTNLVEHRIETSNARPVKMAPRRVPAAFVNEEREAINNMFAQGIIVPSSSPWAAPIVLVRKKNGRLRVCIDYRKLNSLTEKDAFPIPRTGECLD